MRKHTFATLLEPFAGEPENVCDLLSLTLLDVALGSENRGILYSDIFTGVVGAFLTLMMARYYERLCIADSERLRVADATHYVRDVLTSMLYFRTAKTFSYLPSGLR